MSDGIGAGLRAVSFGTPDGSLWAAAVGAGGSPALIVGGDGRALGRADGLSWSGTDSGEAAWRLAGDGVALEVTPATEPPGEADPPVASSPARSAGGPAAGQRLCRVRGTLALSGGERSVDCVGTRVASSPTRGAAGAIGTARLVSAWFSDAEALTVLALRPPGAEHQDADALAATLFDAERWIAVGDPRLSTTYDAAGRPTRTNLELWIGEGEDEFPRRAAGEASGPSEAVTGADLSLSVAPLRCHSRGQEGAGIYALVSPQ